MCIISLSCIEYIENINDLIASILQVSELNTISAFSAEGPAYNRKKDSVLLEKFAHFEGAKVVYWLAFFRSFRI